MVRAAILAAILVASAATLTAPVSAGTPQATLATFAGDWIGHTRFLRIDRQGHAVESVDDGCCDHVLALDFTVSHPSGTKANATATATVTLIHVLDPGDLSPGYHAPRVGQSRQIRIENGVLAESLSDQRYCDAAAESRGSCGA